MMKALISIMVPFFMPLTSFAGDGCNPGQGQIPTHEMAKTSVYYTPIMTTEKVSCGTRSYNVVLDSRGRQVRDCKKIKAILNEQGSGVVRDAHGKALETYIFNSSNSFSRSSPGNCPLGYGSKPNICLNPFRTLAAHMGAGYKTGDVLFFPKSVGMRYPEYHGQPEAQWATHDGYWIVGDVGSKIRGHGRFDFFAADMDWRDSQNPLSRLGFGDSRITHCRVTAARSAEVIQRLGFPGLKPDVRLAWLNSRPQQEIPMALSHKDNKQEIPYSEASHIFL